MQQYCENKSAQNPRTGQKRFTISREIANRKMSNSNLFSDDSRSKMVSSRHSVSSIKSKQNLNLQNLSPASSSFSSDSESKDDESNNSLQIRHNDFEKIAQAHTSFQDLQDKLMIGNASFEQDYFNPLDMSDGIEHSILPIHFIAFEQRWGTKQERQRQQQCGGDEMLLSQASEGRSSHRSLNKSFRTKSIRSKKDMLQSKLHSQSKNQKMDLSDDDDDDDDPTEEKAKLNEDPHIIRKYEKLAVRNPLQDPYYVKLIDLHGFQRLNYELNVKIYQFQAYNDDKQFLKLRKKLVFYSLAIPIICKIIVRSVLFKIIMSFLILFNVTLYIYSQTLKDTSSTKRMEQGIMICFMFEICIRIIASGVIIPKTSFFRNPQDIFDFILVVVYVLNLTEPDIFIVDISPLRVITLLLYLGDIFQGLGVMLQALKSSIKFLLEALMIVGLFSLFFAQTGVFLFQGLFNYRCQFLDGNEVDDSWIQCNQNTCNEGMACLYSSFTPKVPTSFNNVIYAYGQVLRTITMDDWSWVMFFTIRIYHPWTWIYYLLIIFVCGFFGFNLVIAVLKTHYAEAAEEHAQQEEEQELQRRLKENQMLPERDLINVFDVAFLRYIGFFQAIQRYRQALKTSHRSIRLEDNMHEKNETNNKTRILSARQSKNDNEQQNQKFKSFMHKLQDFTLKNILLPKFYILSEKQKQIGIKRYTEDEIEIQILERLKSYKFSQMYSCVNEQIQQEFVSEQDVFPQLNLPDCEKKQMEKEVVQMRSAKLKIVFPDLNKNKKIKRVFENKRPIPKFPIKKPGRLIIIETKDNQEESDTSFLPKASMKKYSKYSMKASTSNNKTPFVLKKQEQLYVHIQGYYLNFEGLQMKIMQKLENENDKKKRKKAEKHNSNEFRYLQLRKNDVQQNLITKKVWSGNDTLLLNSARFQGFQNIITQLNVIDTEIWMVGVKGKIQTFRKYTNWIVKTQFCQLFFDMIILINFTFLALQGIADSVVISNEEDVSTIFLCLELSLRLFSFSLKEIVQSPDYILQTCIVTLNFIELTMSSIMTGTNEQNLRLIRGTKCLLFYRVLKYNKMAIAIGHIAQKTFKQYIYLTFLMFLVIFIYALIGMEMYAGVFDQQDALGQLHSYDNVLKAFMTIFNIMTNDDWYGVYVMGSGINYYFAVIYSYSMVIVLNYITYGLVLAILLDGFGTIDKEMQEQEDKKEEAENNEVEDCQSVQTQDLIENEQNQEPAVSETALSENLKHAKKPNLVANLMKSIKQVHKTILDQNPNLYDGITCQQSLYIFSKENSIRIVCCRIVTSSVFTYLMDCVLYFSIIAFILRTYHDYEIDSAFYPDVLLFISNALFLLEMVIGSIAKGMWMNKGCFITYTWQIVDLVYVISFFIVFFEQSNESIPIISFFLYLGYFRPMKLMYRISWLDTLRLALGRSLFDIWNVLITMLSVWIIFGVYGIILYEQQFGFCEDKMAFEVNRQTCLNENKTWINYKHNFDNITFAIPTLFVISTFDGWGEILQVSENSQTNEQGPIAFNSYVHTYVFFIIFCFIGSMFFLSLFTGVLYSNLKKNQKKIEMTDSTKSQLEFMEITNIIIKDHPLYSSPPTSQIRRTAANITNNLTIQKTIYCLLLVDLIVLLLFYSDMSDEYFKTLNNIHNILTYVYIFWNVLLFLAFGINRYFDNYWRRFYFILITIAIIDIIADFEYDWALTFFRSNPSDSGYQLLRLFFALRCLRIILIFQGLINLQRLMRVMVFALPFLGKIFTILLITMIIFALIGCQLYGSLETGQVMDDQINFKNVAQALLSLFKCASGDDWRTIMTDTMYYNPNCVDDPIYCGGLLNQIYFFLFMLLSNYVLLNLFVLGLVEQFEQFFQLQNSMIQTYVENVDKIKTIWCKYSSDTQGQAMHYKFLCRFLLDIGKPLGGGSDENLWDVGKKASSFKLQCNHFGYIQYNQLMYELFRVCYHQEVFKEGSSSSIKGIKQFNKEMQLRLMYYRRNKFIQRSHVGPVINLRANFNILHDYLTVLIMYKAWEAYSKKLIKKILINQKNFSEQDCEDPDSSEEKHKIQNFIEQDSKEFLNESDIQQNITNENPKQELKHQVTINSNQDNKEQIPVYKLQNDRYSMQNALENIIISPNLTDRRKFTDSKK